MFRSIPRSAGRRRTGKHVRRPILYLSIRTLSNEGLAAPAKAAGARF
jgi:hypothetical protein